MEGGMTNEHLIDQTMDLYCARLSRIDRLGPCCRLIFTVPTTDGTNYHNVVAKLVMPAEFMVTLAYMAAGARPGQVSPELLALETSVAN
jgi:hypothetical protein